MRDIAFRPVMLRRIRASLRDVVVVELSCVKHHIQEDASEGIAAAIPRRIG